MTDYATCLDPRCGTTVEGRGGTCPKCGGAMRHVGESKLRAIALTGLGLFLVLFMGAIGVGMAPQLLRPGVEIDGSTFSGTAEQARLVLLLFGAIILFGLTSTAYGLYMLVTGRRSGLFVAASLLLFAVLILTGWAILTGFG